jgi:hydrogenase maturation factor
MAEYCGSDHCITCADEGVEMTVLVLDQGRCLALCADEEGTRSTVEIGLLDPVRIGDRLLVHAGTAIATAS